MPPRKLIELADVVVAAIAAALSLFLSGASCQRFAADEANLSEFLNAKRKRR